MTFDPTKPVELVLNDGTTYPTRIICTDAKGDKPIVILVSFDGLQEHLYYFTRDGRGLFEKTLRNIPEKCVLKERWANVYEGDRLCFHSSRASADEHATSFRIACVHAPAIEYVVGEGL